MLTEHKNRTKMFIPTSFTEWHTIFVFPNQNAYETAKEARGYQREMVYTRLLSSKTHARPLLSILSSDKPFLWLVREKKENTIDMAVLRKYAVRDSILQSYTGP